jgi:hypothetical protein
MGKSACPADARQIVQAVMHGRHDAKVSAATQRPKQLLFFVVCGDNKASIRENEVRGE